MTRKYGRQAITKYVLLKDAELPPSFSTPRQAAEYLKPLIGSDLVEVGVVLPLHIRHRLIAYREISRGTLDTTWFHPRDVFRGAIEDNAAAVILAHNHPSGDVLPSPDDKALYARMLDVGALVGIPVIDNVIVSAHGYFRFKESGYA